jgi:hypothetical protein
LVVLVALIAILVIAIKTRYAGMAPVKLQADACDSELWKHVYDKERLQVIEECTAVEGRVSDLHRNSDGDLHITLDPDSKSVLNLVNLMHGHGKLVVEAICDHAPSAPRAKAACEGFHSQITIPKAGDRVRVTGSYVTDRDNGWNEVHPVSRIEVLR